MGGGSLTLGNPIPSPNIFASANGPSSAIMVLSPATLSKPESINRTPPTNKLSPLNHPDLISSPIKQPPLSSEHNLSSPLVDVDPELDDNDSLSISLMTPTSSSSDSPKAHGSGKHGEANIQQAGPTSAAHTPKHAASTCHSPSPSLPSVNPETTRPSPAISTPPTPCNGSKQQPTSFQLQKWLQATDKEEITITERIQQYHSLSYASVSEQMLI